jgi:transcriptional regulator with XRE-family HTH domain
MAKKTGVSPTYLSKVERDEFTPPTEDKVRSIAQIIECDPDELPAMAGRVRLTWPRSSSGISSKCRRCCEPPTY